MVSDYGKEYIESFTEFSLFKEILLNMRRTFRVNTLKTSVEEFKKNSNFEFEETIFDFAFSVEKTFTIGNTFEFFMGHIHTQTLSSMIPPVLLNPKRKSIVLDAAASPGGKTTQIAAIMKNNGTIIANDKSMDRLSPLVGNINRLGVLNTAVTNIDARNLPWKNYFNYALADVPCSNLGSSLRAVESITKHRIKDMARVQRKIILSVFDSLKQGGILVYSTCTITEEENEAVVNFLLENRENASIEKIELDIPHEEGLKEYGKEFKKVIRIYPQHLNSEGFFIAKIKKN